MSESLERTANMPRMEGRFVRLRRLSDGDRRFVYDLMTTPQAGGRVRFAGATPSPEKVMASLWDSVLAQFIIEGARSREPVGLVAVTSPNFRDGYAYVSALGAPSAQGVGVLAEGVFLGFHYAFSTWPFRKVYMESSDESYLAFESGVGSFFQEEGRLRQHAFWNGSYSDVRILAVYREVWAEHATRFQVRMAASDDRRRRAPSGAAVAS